jgi:pyruvate-ferredoxin/flavodoxin oxidoreductase
VVENSRIEVLDGNEAAARAAYRASEVIAIYPITPASPMGELADDWSAHGKPNLWGDVPQIIEMQSEGGAAGAVHGALQAGGLATTFTASQGLLLMIPNMYKIAGELTPFCMHVAARTIATHALSIFGDHSDVMACRQIGFAMLASASIQEAHDMACIGHAATLRARVPFLHFFDGFRTSHELGKVEVVADDNLREMLSDDAIAAHRDRALTPDGPVMRGTAQNPDVFFQAREAANRFYDACPDVIDEVFEEFAGHTGRRYRAFEYVGHPQAERVVISMGSGAETVATTVEHLATRGERVGAVTVRVYRPFSVERFMDVLPESVRTVGVLDRTKEPGAAGEPLYQDVVTALHLTGRKDVRAFGGRYGLSSKEFTPSMVRAVFNELDGDQPRHGFTVGIVDDVSHMSLPLHEDAEHAPESEASTGALFYGLGSDGTVGANKNSIKIIADQPGRHVQAYFVYDSKKAGAVTVSHLRFGPEPIRAPYLVTGAEFVACHQFSFLDRIDVLEHAAHGAKFLLNSPYGPDDVWAHLPREVCEQIREKEIEFYVIDAYALAREVGVGPRINTVMQACFFSISDLLPPEEALERIKSALTASYAKKGPEIVRRNVAAVDRALDGLHRVEIPAKADESRVRPAPVPEEAPDFVQRVTATILAGNGDKLPVSAFPVDGTWPTGTSKWEKRNLARDVPVWDPAVCIQCNKCVLACPHAAIRAKVYEPAALGDAPETFKSTDFSGRDLPEHSYTLQVAPEDCTGCRLCVEVCPAKDRSNPRHKAIDMEPLAPIREAEIENYRHFLALPELDRSAVHIDNKTSQFLEPLFEYSGACAGCGETPYLKLVSQLFGDRALIANATGCSSIYGGNLPTTPYTTNADGRGPAWSNSLFEDNAEFGLGMRLAIDHKREQAFTALRTLASRFGDELTEALLDGAGMAKQNGDESGRSEAGIAEQRVRVAELKRKLAAAGDLAGPEREAAKALEATADYLVHKSVWLVGGDGWAYDIGFGGLDHVISTGRDVNILVLDTEVYSNTGGQQSKATPMAAAAKFAIAGRDAGKKDLGMIAMSYGNVYVARVAFGARDQHTVTALMEAEAYPGPSLVIAYSHCIAHGYDMSFGARQQKRAVDSGVWPLYRFDPSRELKGEPPLHLDSSEPKISVNEYMRGEARFHIAQKIDPVRFKRLINSARADAARRFDVYRQLAGIHVAPPDEKDPKK